MLLGENMEESFNSSALDGSCDSLELVDQEEVESFEKLFDQLCTMKGQVSTLEGSERKAYAEKVTMSFWRAMKGDEQEIEGLSSSDRE